MPGKVNIDGSYTGTIIGGGYKVSGSWLTLKTGWQKDSGIWRKILPTFSGTGVTIPAGGIVMYYTTGTVPSGWSEYADSNVILKGWDGTVNTIEATGGSDTFSLTIDNTGSHTGSTFSCNYYVVNSSNACVRNSRYAAGDHGHVGSGEGTHPNLLRGTLIQADSDTNSFPANSVVFGDSLNLFEITTSGTYINGYHNGGSVGGEITPADTTLAITTDSTGSHRHSNPAWVYVYSQSGYRYSASGAHTHAFNITDLSWNLQRKYVKAFTNVLSDFPALTGCIIGWPSNTAPDGWNLCDGTNGTIDLTNYFICCDSNESFGSTGGDNSVSYSYTTDTAGSHNHRGSSISPYAMYSVYHPENITHSHTGSGNISQQFPFVQLAFIQAT